MGLAHVLDLMFRRLSKHQVDCTGGMLSVAFEKQHNNLIMGTHRVSRTDLPAQRNVRCFRYHSRLQQSDFRYFILAIFEEIGDVGVALA